MARKETITMETILDTAFTMTREEGFANVTARKVAVKAGCSTQPIFRVYKSMEELWDAVYLRAVTFFQDYYGLYPQTSRVPFTNLGMAYIAFAREEKHLFELLFLTQKRQGNADNQEPESAVTKSMYEILNGNGGNVVYEINLARVQGCANPGDIFMKMWIFIHGAACMTLTGDYDLSDVETREMLEQSYKAFADNSR